MFALSNGQDVDDIWIGWLPGTGMELYFSDTTDGDVPTEYIPPIDGLDKCQVCTGVYRAMRRERRGRAGPRR